MVNPRKMKRSDIPGVGVIPADWNESRLGYECYIRARLGWRGLKANEYVDEGYAFISAFNIQNGRLVWTPLNFITKERYDESPEIKIKIGDVLIVKDGAGIGKCARVDELPLGGTSPNSSIGVITPHNSLSYKFLCYYFQSPVFSNFVNLLFNGMGVPHLTQEVIKNIRIPFPSINEQNHISNYLDSKCSEIDALSDDIEAQIETLEAYKRSVITEAVTKGLNKNAPMKDSGIEWVGKIPNDWDMKRLQFSLSEIKVQNNPIQTEQVLSLVKDVGVILYEEKGDVGNKAKTDVSEYKLAYPQTLVVNSMNILIGSVGISNYFGCVSPVYYVFKETRNSDLRFINYIFNTREFQKELRKYANGILEIRLRVSADDIFKRKVPTPPKHEQIQIADFLDSKCAEIDSVILTKKKQLEVLADYKKSLIYEYVTGKKEVPADA